MRLAAVLPAAICVFLTTHQAHAAFPFKGRVTGKDINIRADSTVTAEKICTVSNGDPLEVAAQLYEWYKVRLPKTAPAFVRADLLEAIDAQTARISKQNVNIRLKPSESSSIVGKAKSGEVVRIIELQNGWYRIEPTSNTFGWINRSFVEEAPQIHRAQTAENKNNTKNNTIVICGLLKPKVIKTVAAYKVITDTGEIFLLRDQQPEILSALARRKVKITGRKLDSDAKSLAFLEIDKIEALD